MTVVSARDEVDFVTYLAQLFFNVGVRRAFAVAGRSDYVGYALASAGIEWIETNDDASAIDRSCADSSTYGPGLLVLESGSAAFKGVLRRCLRDSLPLLVLDFVTPDARFEDRTDFSKESFDLRPDNASSVLGKAFKLASTEPMGAVHLRASKSQSNDIVPSHISAKPTSVVSPVVHKRDAAVSEVRKLLRNSSRPLIILGSEGGRARAGKPTMALSRVLDAPVFVTPSARNGTGYDDLRLAHDLGGAAGIAPTAAHAASHADLVILMGVDRSEATWISALIGKQVLIVFTASVSSDSLRHIDLLFVANVKQAAEAVAASFPPRTNWSDPRSRQIRDELIPVTRSDPMRRLDWK